MLGIAGYGLGLGFINVMFKFYSVTYRVKNHSCTRNQIQCPFCFRYEIVFSARQQCNPWKRQCRVSNAKDNWYNFACRDNYFPGSFFMHQSNVVFFNADVVFLMRNHHGFKITREGHMK